MDMAGGKEKPEDSQGEPFCFPACYKVSFFRFSVRFYINYWLINTFYVNNDVYVFLVRVTMLYNLDVIQETILASVTVLGTPIEGVGT